MSENQFELRTSRKLREFLSNRVKYYQENPVSEHEYVILLQELTQAEIMFVEQEARVFDIDVDSYLNALLEMYEYYVEIT